MASKELLVFRCESVEQNAALREAALVSGLRRDLWIRVQLLRAAGADRLADAALADAVERGQVGEEPGPREVLTTASVSVRLPPKELEIVLAAVERSGEPRDKWIRTVLRAAAGEGLLLRQLAELSALYARLTAGKPARAAGGRR